MSVNATSHHSNIWTRATTALTTSPDPGDLSTGKTDTSAPAKAAKPASHSHHGPFEKLSNDLQAVLMQWQQAGLGQSATSGSTGGNTGAKATSPGTIPEAGQTGGGPVTAAYAKTA